MVLRLDPVRSTELECPSLVELIRGGTFHSMEVRVGELVVARAALRPDAVYLMCTNRNGTFVQMYGPGSPAAIDHVKGTILTLVCCGVLDFPRLAKRTAHALGLQHTRRGAFKLKERFSFGNSWFEVSIHTRGGERCVYTGAAPAEPTPGGPLRPLRPAKSDGPARNPLPTELTAPSAHAAITAPSAPAAPAPRAARVDTPP